MTHSNHDTIIELIPAYALEALTPDEQALVEEHLAGCADCRTLLTEYRAVAEGLPYTVPQVTAPSHLELDLVRRLEKSEPGETMASFLVRLRTWLAGLFRPPVRLSSVSTVILLLALVVSNLFWLRTVRRLETQQQTLAQQLAAQEVTLRILAQGGRIIILQGDAPAPQAIGALTLAPDRPEAVLIVDGLPPLPAGMTYQLWLIHDGQRDNGGLFQVDASGRGTLLIQAPQPLTKYQAVGVTMEPAGGSPGPTSPRVIGAPLS